MKSIEELRALRDKELAILGIRKDDDLAGKPKIIVCMGTCGLAAGARDIISALVETIAERKLSREIIVEQSDCPGTCEKAPMVKVEDITGKITTYMNMTVDKAIEVLDTHVIGHEIIADYTH